MVGDELPENVETCVLRVKDTGVGITETSISKIYDRYFMVREKTAKHLGSGLGLAMAKNLVLLHGGNITVSSERMKGTEFIVRLPMDLEPSSDQSEGHFDVSQWLQSSPVSAEFQPIPDEVPIGAKAEREERPTVLIVEDNVEFLSILADHLNVNYNVLTAVNGKEGLDICMESYPDLVISDVMMPVMDGVEFCKAVRNNLQIAYMSFIMLTAKSDVESQIEGFEAGADYYLAKPFSMKILDLNVKRLLAYKERMMRDQDVPSRKIREEILEDKDNAFFEKLKSFLEDNISDSDMSVDMICMEMGIGRTRLYAFVKKITGMSLGDYIRELRLLRAADLLKHSDMNITEVLYDTGFSSNSYFSKVFKIRFGMSPSEYIRK